MKEMWVGYNVGCTMGFLLAHSAWQIDQFPTCWPMHGLFIRWSRGWGVLSFSERLVYTVSTPIMHCGCYLCFFFFPALELYFCFSPKRQPESVHMCSQNRGLPSTLDSSNRNGKVGGMGPLEQIKGTIGIFYSINIICDWSHTMGLYRYMW